MNESDAVILRNISKTYLGARAESVTALDDISLTVKDGEFFALLGPSGCGKTTTLRVIAGFEEPSSGELVIAGETMRGVPAFHRPVNTVFQDYALFPHMNVLNNVLFGLKMAGVARSEAHKRVKEALALVQLPHIEKRKPSQLSGGQRQRVALARALVNRPRVLLLDEPLGALDLKLRKTMQLELKTMQRELGISFIFVTHDQEEALTMADRIAVMNAGKVLQVGRPDEIYERPINRFVADFVGETNFIEGKLTGIKDRYGTVKLPAGLELVGTVRTPNLKKGSFLSLAIRPEKIELNPAKTQEAQAQNVSSESQTCITGIIIDANYLGTDTRYEVQISPGVSVNVRSQNSAGSFGTMLEKGAEVTLSWQTRNATILA